MTAYVPSPKTADSTTVLWCPRCGALNHRRFDGRRWRDAWLLPTEAKRPR